MKSPSVRDDKDDIFIMLNSTFFYVGRCQDLKIFSFVFFLLVVLKWLKNFNFLFNSFLQNILATFFHLVFLHFQAR